MAIESSSTASPEAPPLPPDPTPHLGGESHHDPLPRRVGFWGGTAIMAGIMIGSGIFRTPPEIARLIDSPGLILALWAVGGVLSLCGALTYAELAAMHPRSGGVYVFLRVGLGPAVAFVFGWTYMLLSKPFAAAGIAWVFSESVNELFGVAWDPRVTTSVMLTALTAINVRGVGLGAGVAGVLTSAKVLALLAIVLLGGIAGAQPLPATQPASATVAADAAGAASAAMENFWAVLVPALFLILWTYDGWSDIGSIAGEVRDPKRLLPPLYLVGTVGVGVLYLAVNAVYMAVVPLEEMRGVDSVAPLVMTRLVGPAGGVAVTAVVLLSTLGSTHGSIITGARITYAQARDGLLFAALGRVHPRYQTPAVSLWTQLVLSLAALWFAGNFQTLAETFVFTMWIFYGLAGAVIFILRVRRPDAPRPYRCWGYPLVPAIFIAAAAAMTVKSVYDEPKTTLPWLAVLAAGFPVYWAWRWGTARTRG